MSTNEIIEAEILIVLAKKTALSILCTDALRPLRNLCYSHKAILNEHKTLRGICSEFQVFVLYILDILKSSDSSLSLHITAHFTFFFQSLYKLHKLSRTEVFRILLRQMSNMLQDRHIMSQLSVSHRFLLWFKETGIARRYL